jgi:hypothetical protein
MYIFFYFILISLPTNTYKYTKKNMTESDKKHKRTLSKKEYWTERLHSLPSQNSDDEDSDYYFDKASLASGGSDTGSIRTGECIDIENPRLRPGIKQLQQQQKSRRCRLCCTWTFVGFTLLLAVLGALFWVILMDCLGKLVL